MNISLVTTSALVFFACACSQPQKPKLPADKSSLKAATDVFWALDKHGYAIAKDKPLVSKHGCKPSEYLAKKGEALFRISVFHCGDADQARALVEHPKTRHVDSLLRNHHEGGIMRRGPLEIIVRMTEGKKEDVAAILDFLGGL